MSPSNSQLPHLETFSKAAEFSSFTATAECLGITQASVSQRISALEKELGVALFRRQGGRVHLTEAGKKLYDFAQRILDLHKEARQEVTGKDIPISGELLLAASTIPGEHLMPEMLADFRNCYPGIQVRASEADSMDVVAQVEQGKVHLGLVGRKTDAPHLEFQHFASDEMILVVRPDHRWGKRKRVSLEKLCQEPLVVREPGSGSRWCLEQALSQRQMTLGDLQITLELGSNEAIKRAVLKGAGVAVLSVLAVENELDSGELHGVKLADLSLDRTMYVVWDKRRALPAAARIFLRFIEQR